MLLPIAIYLVTAVAGYKLARWAGVRRWLAFAVAYLGPIGLILIVPILIRAWRMGLLVGATARVATVKRAPDDQSGLPPVKTDLAP